MVPRAILRDPDLSDKAKLMAGLLASYAWQDGSCFPGQTRLKGDAGWSVRTVQRALAELEGRGYIRIERRGFMKTNRYVLLFDPIGRHPRRLIHDTSVVHDATPVSYHYRQLLKAVRLKSVTLNHFHTQEEPGRDGHPPNREELVRRFREQLAAAGGGSDMERAVAVALSARLKCSLEEAFQLLRDNQGAERGAKESEIP